MPDGITSIGENAFNECKTLSSIELPDGVKSIGSGSFFSCEGLTSIILPDGIDKIPAAAIKNCKNLKNITLPANLNTIESEAFADLGSDIKITFRGATPPSNIAGDFKFDNFSEIIVPEVSVDKYKEAFPVKYESLIKGDPSLNPSARVTSPAQEHIHIHSWTHGTIYSPTENSDGLEGDYCSCGATRNTSVIPATNYLVDTKIQQIESAYPGKTTILEMKMLNSLSQDFMKKIAEKNNCDFIIRFTYNKKHYEVYIPAGTKFDTSFEWYGPERLMDMFEYKQLY